MKPNAGLAIAVILNLTLGASSIWAQTLTAAEEASNTVAVQQVELHDGAVSGVVVNKSARELREVRLLIRYTWLWKNEHRPGGNNPGRAEYYTVPAEVPPNGNTSFSLQPRPPLPKRSDGRFLPFVEVVGYTEVGT